MTKDRYNKTVSQSLERMRHPSSGISGTCSECQEDYGFRNDAAMFFRLVADGAISDEGTTSMAWCALCHRRGMGHHYVMHYIDSSPDGQLVHDALCEDCLYYLEYGTVPEEL